MTERHSAIWPSACAVLLAYAGCLLCANLGGHVKLGEWRVSLEHLLLAVALLLSVVLALRFPAPRAFLATEVGLTLFLAVVSLPAVLAKGAPTVVPWEGWAYGICFLQWVPLLERALAGRRVWRPGTRTPVKMAPPPPGAETKR